MFDVFSIFARVAAPSLKFTSGNMLPELDPAHRYCHVNVMHLNDKPWHATARIQECKSGKVAQSLKYDLSDENYSQLMEESSRLGITVTESILRVSPKAFAYHSVPGSGAAVI